jgi:hypothetical protein
MLPDATVSADAQEMINCDARDVMTNALMNDYAEQPAGLGVTNTGAVIELWKAEGGSSWALLLTMPDGHSCIVVAGSD